MGPEVLEIEPDPSRDPIAHDFRDVDASRLGQRLKARGDVDAVAKDFALLFDNVIEIDPDAQRNALVGQQRLVQ